MLWVQDTAAHRTEDGRSSANAVQIILELAAVRGSQARLDLHLFDGPGIRSARRKCGPRDLHFRIALV
jgi:hypothetical protein